MKKQSGGLGVSKQYDILSSAVGSSAIWLEKIGADPGFSENLPDNCRRTMNTGGCGLKLTDPIFGQNVVDYDGEVIVPGPRLEPFLQTIDDHVISIHPESRGKKKCFLLISDMSRYGSSTNPFTSRVMHAEIVVGEKLETDALNVMYGWGEEYYYPGASKHCRLFRNYVGKIYGLVYLGLFVDSLHSVKHIIDTVSLRPLPPNQDTKLRSRKKHRYSRWAEDTYEDSRGNTRQYCDRNGGEYNMAALFRAPEYHITDFNCQSFCKAFMSILRCPGEGGLAFTPYSDGAGKNNLKLDVTQLSAWKGVWRRDKDYYDPDPNTTPIPESPPSPPDPYGSRDGFLMTRTVPHGATAGAYILLTDDITGEEHEIMIPHGMRIPVKPGDELDIDKKFQVMAWREKKGRKEGSGGSKRSKRTKRTKRNVLKKR